ncbi:hypothetical protein WJX73_006976 [Symbiochloris irregularis]|uniref:Uncharacterized protein n=1 Tax=Symbiochloris irregularis TaxID=706552 RepID=A0AAW1NXB4_9CHLO
MSSVTGHVAAWRQVTVPDDQASVLERAGFTATVVKSYLYIVGGMVKSEQRLNDTWKFDIQRKRFLRQLPDLPGERRAYHSATLTPDNKIWVIGGADDKLVFGDVFCLDTATDTWRTVDIRGRSNLLRRCAHGAALHPGDPDIILVFGGYAQPGGDGSPCQFHNDLLAVNIRRKHVDVLSPSGMLPEPRGWFAFATLGMFCFILCGRRFAEHGAANARNVIQGPSLVVIYDVASNSYIRPKQIGSISPRSGHQVAQVNDSLLVCAAQPLRAQCQTPCRGVTGRAGHALKVVLQSSQRATLWQMGGYGNRANRDCSDIWALELTLSSSGASTSAAAAPAETRAGPSNWRTTKRARIELPAAPAAHPPGYVALPTRTSGAVAPVAAPVAAMAPPVPRPAAVDPRIAELQRQFEHLTESNAASDRRVVQLEADKERLSGTVARADQQWRQYAEQSQKDKNEIERLTSRLADEAVRNTQLKEAHKEMGMQLHTERAKVKQAEEAIQAAGVAHNQQLAEWRGAHDATLAERDRALAEQRQRLTAADTQLADMRDRLSHAQVTLARKEHDLEVAQQRFRECDLKLTEQKRAGEVAEATSREALAGERRALSAAREDAQRYCKQAEERQGHLRSLAIDLEDAKKQHKDLEARVVREAEDARQLRAQMTTVTADYARLKEQHDQLVQGAQSHVQNIGVYYRSLCASLNLPDGRMPGGRH